MPQGEQSTRALLEDDFEFRPLSLLDINESLRPLLTREEFNAVERNISLSLGIPIEFLRGR